MESTVTRSRPDAIIPDPAVFANPKTLDTPRVPVLSAWKILAGTLWLASCLAGCYAAMSYDFQPGRLGPRQSRWPIDTTLVPSPADVTVVAFLHPRCPCTAATVKQLIRTLQRHPGSRLIAVVFAPPEPTSETEWEHGEYVQTIRAEVPAARIVPDPGGVEARRFGASTSGTILVYDRNGNETFRGGITDRRGGEGTNPGLCRFDRALAEEGVNEIEVSSPVFGCPLESPPSASSLPQNNGDTAS
jgi:hypothetical protein